MPNDIATIDQAGASVTAEVSETVSAGSGTYSVERAVENIGDMNALVGWMNTNLGIFGAQKALQNAAFLLCCDVISQDLAKSRMYLRKRLDNGTSQIVTAREHPVAAMLAYRPNPHMTWHEYHEMMMFWLPLTQNAHAIVDRTVVGDPAGLVPIMTSQQHPFVLDERLYYDCTAGNQFSQLLMRAPYRRVFEEDMIHVRGRMMNGFDGLSTLFVGRSTLNTAASIDAWRDDIFTQQGQIRGIFKKPDGNPLPDLAFERLRMGLRSLMSRFRQNIDPVVLESGMEFQSMASNPTEAQLSAQFEQQIIAVGRLLRVPPHKLFQMGGVKYENLDTLENAYIGDTLLPNFDRSEQRHTITLLTPKEIIKGLFLEHDRDAVQLNDPAKQAAKAEIAAKYGSISVDELRALLYRFAPLPNGAGKLRTLPTQTQLIDDNNKVVVGGAGVAPETSTPANPPAKKDVTDADL